MFKGIKYYEYFWLEIAMMKKQNRIFFTGIISILILVSVQAFIITGIWNQKSEMFSLQYTMRSQEGMHFINRVLSTDGFDAARLFLAQYSEETAKELRLLSDTAEINRKKKEVLDYFTIVLNEEQDLSQLLTTYFELRGYEKSIVFSIVLNELDIIDNDTIPIFYQNPTREIAEPSLRARRSQTSKSRIFINWFGMEDNYYKLRFEYFIDFSDKQKIIFRESAITLTMSVFSIIVVVMIFIVAYRNLMEEKRLSNLKTDFINNMTHELKTPLATINVAGKTLETPELI
jgi:two-component system phosphate regulon sensor histidine kinase PhoR